MSTCVKCGTSMTSWTTINGLAVCEWCKPKLCTYDTPKPSETEGVGSWQCSCNYQTMVVDRAAYDKLQAEHRADLKTAIEREYKLQQELSDARREVEKYKDLLHTFETCETSGLVMKNHELELAHKGISIALKDERTRSAELLSALKGCVGYEPFGPADLNPYKASEAIAKYEKHNSGKGG